MPADVVDPAPSPPPFGAADGGRLAEVQALREGVRHLLIGMDRLRTVLAHDLGLGLHELAALGHVFTSPGITPKDLAQQLGVTRGSATGIIDRLEEAGFVARAAHPSDRRSVVLELTPAGGHARAHAVAILDQALTDACAPTAIDRIRDLTTLLTAASTHIERAATSPHATAAPPLTPGIE